MTHHKNLGYLRLEMQSCQSWDLKVNQWPRCNFFFNLPFDQLVYIFLKLERPRLALKKAIGLNNLDRNQQADCHVNPAVFFPHKVFQNQTLKKHPGMCHGVQLYLGVLIFLFFKENFYKVFFEPDYLGHGDLRLDFGKFVREIFVHFFFTPGRKFESLHDPTVALWGAS